MPITGSLYRLADRRPDSPLSATCVLTGRRARRGLALVEQGVAGEQERRRGQTDATEQRGDREEQRHAGAESERPPPCHGCECVTFRRCR